MDERRSTVESFSFSFWKLLRKCVVPAWCVPPPFEEWGGGWMEQQVYKFLRIRYYCRGFENNRLNIYIVYNVSYYDPSWSVHLRGWTKKWILK